METDATGTLGVLLAGAAGADFSAHVRRHGPLHIPGRTPGARAALTAAIAEAGLRGRGGGGFPTAKKLALYARARTSLLVVNATEGEPASAKDAVLCTRAPHLVLDGAEVVAALIGARRVVVALEQGKRALADVLATAIRARPRSRAAADFTLVETPAGYVSGEESALANYLVTGVARPFFRPTKSEPLRRRRETVLVQNAETLAHIAVVARDAERDGPPRVATTLVTLAGAVARPGVVEVALGTPIVEIVARAAPVGPPAAVLVGGYGGTWLSAPQLSTGFDAASLSVLGAKPGAGVLAVLDAAACGLAETARVVRLLAGESAGQCGPCVFGLPALADDCEALARGGLDAAGFARLQQRAELVVGRGACAHPDGVARLVSSALVAFAADVARHLAGQPCAGARRQSVLLAEPRRVGGVPRANAGGRTPAGLGVGGTR